MMMMMATGLGIGSASLFLLKTYYISSAPTTKPSYRISLKYILKLYKNA